MSPIRPTRPTPNANDAFEIERSIHLAHHLRTHGAGLLAVACNIATATATAAADEVLRSALPNMPIVGIEPGLKPALAITRNGCVGVMATCATLASARFAAQCERGASAVRSLAVCGALASV